MGGIPENEQAWNRKAQAEQIKCNLCKEQIPFGERQVYFETGLCGYCAHQQEKDD